MECAKPGSQGTQPRQQLAYTQVQAPALTRNPDLVPLAQRSNHCGLVLFGYLAVATPSNFYFQSSGLAPVVSEPMADWWPDYLNDTKIRKDYFFPDTELLKDPTFRQNGRLWHHDRIIVPQTRLLEIISQYHDLPSVGHWGVNRTV